MPTYVSAGRVRLSLISYFDMYWNEQTFARLFLFLVFTTDFFCRCPLSSYICRVLPNRLASGGGAPARIWPLARIIPWTFPYQNNSIRLCERWQLPFSASKRFQQFYWILPGTTAWDKLPYIHNKDQKKKERERCPPPPPKIAIFMLCILYNTN